MCFSLAAREVKQLQCQVKELTSRIQQLARLVQDAGGKLPAWVSLPANQPIPPPLGKRQFLYSNRITQEELTDKSVHEKVLEPKQKKARKAAPKKKEANTSKKKRPRAAKKSESVASNANKDSAIKPPTVAQLLNVPSSSTSSVAGTSGIVLLPPEKPASIDIPPGILVLKGSSSQPAASTNSNLSSAGLLIVRTPASQSSSLAPGTCILLPSSSSQTPPTQQSPAQTTSLLTTPIMATGQPPSSSTATPTFVLTNGSLVPVLSSQNSAKQSLPLAAKPAQENKNSNKIAIPKLPKRNVKSTKSPAKKKKAIIEAVVNLEPIKSIVVSSGSEIIDAPKDVPLPKSPEKQEEESKEEASKSESPAVKASESSGKHKSSYSIDALCQGKQTPTDSEEASTEALAAAESSKGEEKVEKSSDKPAEQVAEPKEVAYPSEKPQETPLAYTESMSVCNNYSGHEFVPAEISPSGFIGPQPPMATVVDAPSKEALDTYPDSYRAEHRSSPEVIPSSFSSDLFASLNVPSGHPESISPTAAFLLAFPLVSSSTGRTNEAEQPDRVDNTGGNSLLQLGSMDEPSSVVELNSLMQQGPRHHELVAVSKMSQGPREAKQYCFPLNEPVADYDAEISSIMSHTPTNKQFQPRLANNFSRPKPHKDNCVREPYTASDKQFVPLPVQNSPTLYPSAHAMQQPMYACSKKQLPVQQAPYQQNPAAHYPMQNSPRCNIVNYNQPIFSTSVASSNIQSQKPIPSNPPRSDVCSQKPSTEQSYNQPIFSTSTASSNIQSQKPSNSPKQSADQRDGYNNPMFSTSTASSNIQSQKPSNSQVQSTEQREGYHQPIFSTSAASSNIQSQKPSISQVQSTEQREGNHPIFSMMEQSYNQPIFSTSVANSNIQSQKPIPSNPPRNDVSSQKPLTEQSYNQPIFGSSAASSSIQSQKPSNSQKHSIEQRDSYSHSIFSASVASSNIQPQKPSNSPRTDVCSQKHPTEQRDTSHFIGKLNTNKPESNNSQKYKMSSPEGGKPQSKPVVNDSRFDSQQRLNLVPTTTADQTYVSKPVVNESRFDAQQRLNLVPTTTSSQAYACNIFNDYQSSNYLPLPPLSSVSSSATTDTATSSFGSFSVAHNSSNFGILSWSTLSPMSASNSQQQQVPSYSVDGQKQGYQHSGDNNRYQQRQISYPPPTKEAVPPTPRPPVNWMTDIPAQNSFEQAASYGSSYPDYADALNNTWQKSSSQANPLPTLVGDLALGPTPTTKYCYKAAAARKQPDKEKRGGDYCSSFLSVSQLVDHTTVKEPSRPPPPSRKSGRPASKASSRRDRSKNTQAFNETIASSAPTTYRPISNYPAPKPSYKATPSNYSAESLIAGIHPPPQQQDLILHDKSERYPQSYPPRSHFSGESTNYFPESLDPNYQQSSYPCSGNYQASGNNYMNQTTFPDTDLAASSSIPAPSFPPDFLFPVTTAASVTSRPSFFPGSDVKSSSRKRSRHLEQAEPGYQDYQLQDFNAGRSTQQVRCEAAAAQNCAPTYRAAAGQVSTPPSNSVPGVASSSLTNFNLSTIFPDLNDKTPVPPLPAFVSSKNLGAGAPLLPGAGTDYMLHHSNMGFNNLLSHNAPHQVGMRLNQSFATPSFPNMMPPPSLPFSVHEH
ncbi:hypothetical protein B566_EDAN013783 [Ephemera danica]|nr:hypothetical protein B566_EDAN013783 [Ephemera danica]